VEVAGLRRSRVAHANAVAAAFTARWALRILLPLAGVAAMLALFPYRGRAGGIDFEVHGSVGRPGISADTTFGSWQFPHVTALPVGAHISPEDVDVVRLAASATQDRAAFVESLRHDVEAQLPRILTWLAVETVLGVLLGLAAAAAIGLAIRHLRGEAPRSGERRRRLRGAAAAMAVLALLATFGLVTYDREWPEESRTTGSLAALQLFPGQLASYYEQRSKFTDVLGGIATIQAQLQERIGDPRTTAPAAFNLMFVSDMHLSGNYPLVRQYAKNFDVRLIVNTGDESEFGTRAEMTPAYRAQLAALTAEVPMIWLAGNHDSPDTVAVMRSIPGVTVLGRKTATGDGFDVTAEQVEAGGLTIAGLPDPRVYGAAGEYGADADDVVDPLERRAVDAAVASVPATARFDIFATHEPVAANRLAEDLPGQIRQTNSGHTHVQNADDEIRRKDRIDLVEGSTGAGGLDNLDRGGLAPPPAEFSIETVAVDCQFTKVVRFQLPDATSIDPTEPTAAGRNVTSSTVYLAPDPDLVGRLCTSHTDPGPVSPLPAG